MREIEQNELARPPTICRGQLPQNSSARYGPLCAGAMLAPRAVKRKASKTSPSIDDASTSSAEARADARGARDPSTSVDSATAASDESGKSVGNEGERAALQKECVVMNFELTNVSLCLRVTPSVCY